MVHRSMVPTGRLYLNNEVIIARRHGAIKALNYFYESLMHNKKGESKFSLLATSIRQLLA